MMMSHDTEFALLDARGFLIIDSTLTQEAYGCGCERRTVETEREREARKPRGARRGDRGL